MKLFSQAVSKKKKFWFLIGIYFLLVIADGILTFIGTPDLKNEGNPLVTVFGLGWGALFIANVIILTLYVILVYYSFVHYESILLPSQGMKQYLSMLYYGRPDKIIWILYKIPKNKAPFLANSGYAFGIAFPIARMILVLEWVGQLTGATIYFWYEEHIRSLVPWGRVDVAIGLIVIMFCTFYWSWKEYQKNKSRLAREVSAHENTKE